MRFPSLFRLPRYQQFQIKPRYYDPIKEEIKNRTEQIQSSMENEGADEHRSANFNFKRRTSSAPATSMMQLIIAVVLGLMVLGWLQFGNNIFYYLLWVIVPGYFLYRLRTFRKKK